MRRILLTILLAAGCSAGGISSQGTVTTGGSTGTLAFAQLVKGGTPDLAAVSASRGVVEVFTYDNTSWSMVGSFFAGGVAVDVARGHVSGNDVVTVLWDTGTVAVLPPDPMNPHQLLDPFQIYRRIRNNTVIDVNSPPAQGFAMGDLDGDGNDELLVGSDAGFIVVVDLAMLLMSNPEKPAPGNGFVYNAGPAPGAVAAVDVDGDGRLDAVVLDRQQAAAYVFGNGGGPSMMRSPAKITLPQVGKRVVATGCPNVPIAILLSDGTMVSVTKDGKTTPVVADLTPIAAVASTRASVAMAWGKNGQIALYDACTTTGSGVFPNLPTQHVANLTISSTSTAGAQEMALLDNDGKTLSIYSVLGF